MSSISCEVADIDSATASAGVLVVLLEEDHSGRDVVVFVAVVLVVGGSFVTLPDIDACQLTDVAGVFVVIGGINVECDCHLLGGVVGVFGMRVVVAIGVDRPVVIGLFVQYVFWCQSFLGGLFVVVGGFCVHIAH